MRLVREYIYELMTDKKKGFVSGALKGVLSILSFLYGAILRAHNALYRNGILKRYKAGVSVVSVGNITLGGTGKTPFVMMLSRKFAEHGALTGVLIRGYGEDEWKLLDERLGAYGIKIFVGRDRVEKSKIAEKEGMDVVVLDDGFQHLRLKRDLDILLVDASSPFGNRKLFPRGILREPLSSLKRADIVVITKSDAAVENIDDIKDNIKCIVGRKKILKAVHKPLDLRDLLSGELKPLSLIAHKKVCLVSAICDPFYFKHTLRHIGAEPELEFIFPDHHEYDLKDIEAILGDCASKDVKDIIITEKDAVKIKHLITGRPLICNFFVLRVDLEITDGKETLDAEVNRLYLRNRR